MVARRDRTNNTGWGGVAVFAKQELASRVVLLEKIGAQMGQAMSSRPSTITSPICRCWGTMRLECMSPWIREWALPEMHAGIPEMGAVDAWHEVSDIAKFFDQIRRDLVFRICKAAGMPT